MKKLIIMLMSVLFASHAGAVPVSGTSTKALASSSKAAIERAVNQAVKSQTKQQTPAQKALLQAYASYAMNITISLEEFLALYKRDIALMQRLNETMMKENDEQIADFLQSKQKLSVTVHNSPVDYSTILSPHKIISIQETETNPPYETVKFLRQLRKKNPQARILFASWSLQTNGIGPVLEPAKSPSSDELKALQPAVYTEAKKQGIDVMSLESLSLISPDSDLIEPTIFLNIGKYLLAYPLAFADQEEIDKLLYGVIPEIEIAPTTKKEQAFANMRYIEAVAPFYDIVVVETLYSSDLEILLKNRNAHSESLKIEKFPLSVLPSGATPQGIVLDFLFVPENKREEVAKRLNIVGPKTIDTSKPVWFKLKNFKGQEHYYFFFPSADSPALNEWF